MWEPLTHESKVSCTLFIKARHKRSLILYLTRSQKWVLRSIHWKIPAQSKVPYPNQHRLTPNALGKLRPRNSANAVCIFGIKACVVLCNANIALKWGLFNKNTGFCQITKMPYKTWRLPNVRNPMNAVMQHSQLLINGGCNYNDHNVAKFIVK